MMNVIVFDGVTVDDRLTDIYFEVAGGQCLAVLGESSSAIAEIESVLLRRTEISAGEIVFDGAALSSVHGRDLKRVLSAVEVLKSFASLADARQQLERVNASASKLVVMHEPLRGLGAIETAEAYVLLRQAVTSSSKAWLLLTSNAMLVHQVADRAQVLYLDRVVESGTAAQVIAHAQHPYTQALISAVPQLDPFAQAERTWVKLNPASGRPEGGCAMVDRCPFKHRDCAEFVPELIRDEAGHEVACIYPQERKVIVTAVRRPHAVRPMPRSSLLSAAHKPDYHGPVTGRDFVSD
jgi:oligopeptide/dipeptide ABC transporter ATP-binding protein